MSASSFVSSLYHVRMFPLALTSRPLPVIRYISAGLALLAPMQRPFA